MATGIVLVDKAAGPVPPIWVAARYLFKATRLKLDRIRVETLGGAAVAEFPTAQVEQFLRTHGLRPQPDRVIRQDRGDYERHRPIWAPGRTPNRDDSRTGVTEPVGSVVAKDQ